MPENRFGGVNQQPLYNVTGRNERGEAPQQSKFQAPAAGVQKDFGASNMPNNAQAPQGGFVSNMMQSAQGWGPASPLSIYGRGGGGRGRRGRGGGGDGGGGGGGNDYSIHIDSGNFSAMNGENSLKNDQSGLGGINDKSFTTGGTPAEPAATATAPVPKPKTPRTDEQRAQRTARDQQNRSGERTPKPRGPKPKPAAVAPAAAGGTTTTTNTNNATIQANTTKQDSVRGHTYNVGRGAPPAAGGPGEPGAPAITFGGVKGATVNGPASIGSTKVGRK